MMNYSKEIWKDINGYKGIYKVSNMGRVRSISRRVKTSRKDEPYRILKGHLLKQTDGVDHYYQITLSKNKHKKNFQIQDLVARAFCPNPHHLKMVNHKNENRHDNRASNLEYCTAKYNNNYGNHNRRLRKHWKEHGGDYAIIVGHGIAKVFSSMRQAALFVSKKYGGSASSTATHFINIASNRSKRRSSHGFIASWYNLPLTKPNIRMKAQLMQESYLNIRKKLISKKSAKVKMFNNKITKTFNTANDAKDWLLKNNYTHCKPVSVRNAVDAVCKGRRKHCYGFSAKYVK